MNGTSLKSFLFLFSAFQTGIFCLSGSHFTDESNHHKTADHILNRKSNYLPDSENSLRFSQPEITSLSFFQISLSYSFTEDIFNVNNSYEDFDFNIPGKKLVINRNVFRVERRNRNVSHSGHNFVFLETFSINSGNFSQRKPDNTRTGGYEFRMKGLFMILNDCSDDSALKFISDHLDIRFFKSEYSVNHYSEVESRGISFVISGINF
jgi:hypothetical protein